MFGEVELIKWMNRSWEDHDLIAAALTQGVGRITSPYMLHLTCSLQCKNGVFVEFVSFSGSVQWSVKVTLFWSLKYSKYQVWHSFLCKESFAGFYFVAVLYTWGVSHQLLHNKQLQTCSWGHIKKKRNMWPGLYQNKLLFNGSLLSFYWAFIKVWNLFLSLEEKKDQSHFSWVWFVKTINIRRKHTPKLSCLMGSNLTVLYSFITYESNLFMRLQLITTSVTLARACVCFGEQTFVCSR